MANISEQIDRLAQHFEEGRKATESKLQEYGKESGQLKSTVNEVSNDLQVKYTRLEAAQKEAVKANEFEALKSRFEDAERMFKDMSSDVKRQIEEISAAAVLSKTADNLTVEQKERLAKHKRNQIMVKWLQSAGEDKKQNSAAEIFKSEVDEMKAIYVGNDPSAGYLADRPQYERMFDEFVYEFSTFRQSAEVIVLNNTNHIERPVNLKGGVGAAWETETVTRTDTGQPIADMQQIYAHWARASVLISEQQLQDSYLDVEGWVTREAAQDFALLEDDAYFNGNGVNKPRGILTLPATAAAAGSTYKYIQQVNSGANGAFTPDGILELIGSMKEEYHNGAEFFMRREDLFTGLYTLQDNDDRYYLVPDWSNGLTFRLLGYPVRMAYPMPVAATNSLSMVFANLQRGYTIVERSGLTILNDPYSHKPYVELWFRRRVGGDIRVHEAIKIQKLAV